MKMRLAMIVAAMFVVGTGQAHALTLKSGQVLGSDGNIYDGASPAVLENMIKNAERTGKMAGVSGRSVYVVVAAGDTKDVVFIDFKDLAGKDKDAIQETVLDKVVSHLNAGTNLGFNAAQIGAELDRETASAAQIAAADAAREVAIQDFEAIVESLEGATIEQIEEATGSTLISREVAADGTVTETFY